MPKKNYGKSSKDHSKKNRAKRNGTATKKPFAANKGPVYFRIIDASKQTPPAGSPYSLPGAIGSPFFPVPTQGNPECIFYRFAEHLKNAQKAATDGKLSGQEIMFGVKVPFPNFLDKLTSFDAKMKLLEAWDKQNQAHLIWSRPTSNSLAEHFGVKDTSKFLADAMNEFTELAKQLYHEAKEIDSPEDAQAPTEQELVEAYELWQYEQRKALGEPVLFQDGHLRFERILADNCIQPGPFPGLDLYSQCGQRVEPQVLTEWLDHMKPQRDAQEGQGVGFFGCPNCPIWAADMVRVCSYLYQVCGSESYRTYIWGNGQPAYNLVVAYFHALSALESGKPLPCLRQG